MSKKAMSASSIRSKELREISLDEILKEIKEGGSNTELIEIIRKTTNKEIRTNLKQLLEIWMPNGVFKTKDKDGLIELNGLMYFDIDSVDNPEGIKEYLKQIDYVYTSWISVSANGLGILCSSSGLTANNYKHTWITILDDLKKRLPGQLNFDVSVKNINRLNFISFDPGLFINEDVKPFLAIEKPIEEVNKKETIDYSSNFEQLLNMKSYSISTTGNSLEWKTTLDTEMFSGQTYYFTLDGLPFIDIWFNKKIREGNRKSTLMICASKLMFINPSLTVTALARELNKINFKYFIPAIENPKDVYSIANWTVDKFKNNELSEPKMRIKYTWFPKDVELTVSEKKSIAAKNTGVVRRNRTINLLKNVYEKLKEGNCRITQKLLASESKKSIQSVKKYWKFIQ